MGSLHVKLGYLYRLLGKNDRAEAIARTVIAKDPSNASAWRLLGLELAGRADRIPPDEGLEEDALRAYSKAHELAPSNYYIACNLICYLGFLGRLDEGRTVIQNYAGKGGKKSSELSSTLEHYKDGSTRGLTEEEKHKCY